VLRVVLDLLDAVGDDLRPSSTLDSTKDVRTSYDDLRRMNRAKHEKERYESINRASQPIAGETTSQPPEPLKPRK